MLTITKPVYYCEFCKRHRLTKNAIETHEPRCIYNPERSKCGWHNDGEEFDHPSAFVPEFRANLDVDWLRTKAIGCPVCMLAVVVQAVKAGTDREDFHFDYKGECERFRATERETN